MNQQKTILPFRAMSSLLLRGAQLLQPLSRHPNPTATLCYAHMGNYWSSESLFPKYQGEKCHIQPLPIQEYACSLHLLHTAAGEVQELILLTPFHLWINNSGEVLFEVTAGERWSFRFQSSMKQKRDIKKKKVFSPIRANQTPACSTMELNNPSTVASSAPASSSGTVKR